MTITRTAVRRQVRRWFFMGAMGMALGAGAATSPVVRVISPYTKWAAGPSRSDAFFPIAVWLQDPRNAPRYRELGFNLFVGLWKGPTAEQLAALKAAGMPVICEQNDVALADPNRDIIVGWMHGDEPDNAQEQAGGGYGPPVEPQVIQSNYRKILARDPSRPVLLNLGQGVAWDGWHGRGTRTNHPEDYPAYLEGCDIASFDIYPVVHDRPEVAGKLEYVGRGVDRLRTWAGSRRLVWNCLECTRISNVRAKPTPEQVRSEAWMALIHGSQGLIWFAHQFKPEFIEAGLLADAELARAVGALNRQILELAPVLNTPTREGGVGVMSSDGGVPVDVMVKPRGQETYVFAVAMRNRPTRATFMCRQPAATAADVLGEDRTIPVTGGVFSDAFGPYAVHLYRLR